MNPQVHTDNLEVWFSFPLNDTKQQIKIAFQVEREISEEKKAWYFSIFNSTFTLLLEQRAQCCCFYWAWKLGIQPCRGCSEMNEVKPPETHRSTGCMWWRWGWWRRWGFCKPAYRTQTQSSFFYFSFISFLRVHNILSNKLLMHSLVYIQRQSLGSFPQVANFIKKSRFFQR